MKFFYQILYRYTTVPWEIGPRTELVDLVESGQLKPGRALDLGCGTGANCVFLAKHGFDVVGVDFAPAAIEKAKALASEAGTPVEFVVDDLTNLKQVTGTFDLLIDYGTLDDLQPQSRDRYMENVIPLTHPGSVLLLYAHEWKPKWWERPFYSSMALDLGEAESRFSPYFQIEEIVRTKDRNGIPRGYAVYLMTRM
jgi:SAM-dependent methyltransferase